MKKKTHKDGEESKDKNIFYKWGLKNNDDKKINENSRRRLIHRFASSKFIHLFSIYCIMNSSVRCSFSQLIVRTPTNKPGPGSILQSNPIPMQTIHCNVNNGLCFLCDDNNFWTYYSVNIHT